MNFTTREICCLLGLDEISTTERIKHWVRCRLLKPIGGIHPGTGNHRSYNLDTLIDLIVLNALADVKLSVISLPERIIDKAFAEARHCFRSGKGQISFSLNSKTICSLDLTDEFEKLRRR